ncbi:MAG: Glu/Leu/Phe/Val dehydrogenase dimerization domain-containing protein [Actinomycetota bacterium]
MFEDLIASWDGELVAVRHDEPSGAWMFLGVHSTALGPAMGGTRLKVYASPHDALADGLRLAQAMSMKQAAAGLPFGGGKAVLAVPSIPAPGSQDRRGLLLRYGSFVDALHGTYVTAADMNTGPADLDVVREVTPHVMGTSPERGGAGDSGGATATGVFHAIAASAAHAFGDPSLAGRSVLVQGVGSVGARLARLLAEAGATVLLSDVDDGRAASLASELRASSVPADAVPDTPCDVFAPCATGGVLNADTIPRLACRVVAGAANNQLGAPEDAGRLSARGILYAPDYVANAGGVIHLAGYEVLGWDDDQILRRLEGIGETLGEVFWTAERDGTTTAEAADRIARARIAAAGV